jgi:small nuclear ribonucleoprotein D3|eukprot:CAMPEP_0174298052 /NCGR_PEP_ID=MMETSP0809-20121228/52687_1 /TAXON_ID=73025 ORGANISM="Eutreptiella gymnastica-like, Strain CCMP1594" /NCGR_SAMPLE_ID=MMETSP0809 /ASSEMBLY_ACC=CAM_ASM_000658 /LENGTH=114 /DNA_ID=CAMNT_0015402243 /DNA_START=27 /DNA_END=371 /DNA_ORIENTATION=+
MTSRGVGIPVKLLHEAEGHTVTVETITGETYRGFLSESEDNMNCKINNLTMTHRDGKTTTLEQVFLRGSKIRFMVLPDMLKNAPMFKQIGEDTQGRGRGVGYGVKRGGKQYVKK